MGALNSFRKIKIFCFSENAITEFMELNKSFVGQKLAQVAKFAELEEEDLTAANCWMFWQYEKLNQNPENFSKVAAVAEALLDLKAEF